ncbi:MAG: gluconate:H+ symporter [Bacteroidales bacterium]|nr:gluconate:H+ symporter [Bacteroidales bacterium]MBS3774905.1 gluconate:H+ symporter [Bacteroidales bacterium]
MSETYLVISVAAAILILLFLVLKLKIHAFLSLLLTSIIVGLMTGMEFTSIIESIEEGMASTLGFVATVVGLGAIFGQLLEASGGAESIAHYMLKKFGWEKASWALVFTGFIIAIPVFLDVGFVILIPIIYALGRETKRSLLLYGIPLLAGLAVTHAFIPPTPGPVAVAQILDVQLGWIIIFGIIVGIPTAIIAGPVFGKYISKKIQLSPPDYFTADKVEDKPEIYPSFRTVVLIIALPLVLIIIHSVTEILYKNDIMISENVYQIFALIGHPFTALTIATLLALYVLGYKKGFSKAKLSRLSGKALGPAGLIILVTGAGGVFKQVLIDSGVGEMVAENMKNSSMPPIVLAYLLAVIVRVTQGSNTVSMITAAGIMAPVLPVFDLSQMQTALVVLSIASGATILSHVNDSGFWLVGKYMGMDEKQTLKSWTIMETIISITGFIMVLLLSLFI